MLPKYEFKTKKGKLILQCLDIVEPNNGRMLYEVSLKLDDVDLTDKYFGNWNYINFYLDNYISTSNDNEWIYIPNEGSHFLIRTNDLQKIVLPYIGVFAVTFIKNAFLDKYFLILSTESIIIKNLKNGKTQKLDTTTEKITFKNYIKYDDKIVFNMSNDEILTFKLIELE